MKALAALGGLCGALALSTIAPSVAAAATAALPMDGFNDAFYTCDNGAAFAMSYDSSQPSTATMTTSNDNARHTLKKTKVARGEEFAGGPVTFWTDGQSVVVTGASTPFRDCKVKPS
jgi:membrane-bound inhibitor of C-type lysozyme